MKKGLLILFLNLVISAVIFGQERTLTGRVISGEDGEPLPGVTVLIKGTTIGVVTDIDGRYSIDFDGTDGVLQFSFVGMEPVERAITESNVYDVTMEPSVLNLDEVVVTALGISRERRTLGYAVQTLSGDELLETRDPSIYNTLAGKVAGVQVTRGGGTLGSSSYINIRGNASFSGNSPLIVIDGTPVDNRTTSIGGAGNAIDWGDTAADIDPNIVESITVLKGANASALYGSRATNGVILIETKKGKTDRGIGVSISSSTEFVQPHNFLNWQNEYGVGINGDEYAYNQFLENNPGSDLTYNEYAKQYSYNWEDGMGGGVNDSFGRSFGPRLDEGLLIDQFSTGPDSPWISRPTNWTTDFYQTGMNLENSVSINASGEKSFGRLSYTRMNQTGIHWNEGQQRNALNASFTLTPSDRISATTNVTYSNRESDNIAQQGYGRGATFHWTRGRNHDMKYERDLFFDNDYQNSLTQHGQSDNIFYSLNNTNSLSRNRVFGNTNVVFNITDWLSATARVGLDHYDEYRKQITRSGTWGNINAGRGGSFSENQLRRQELNTDLFLQFDKSFGDYRIDGTVGGNYRNQAHRQIGLSAGNLTVPDLFTIGNVAGTPGNSMYRSEREVQSVFGAANVSFRDFLFLGVTGRNDWSSTLPADNRSYFYPSVSLGFTVTEALGIQSDFLNYAQLRGSWAEVGSDTGPYQLSQTYGTVPFASITYFRPGTVMPPINLKPEITSSYEIGADIILLDNRFSADVTYYSQTTRNQILNVPVSRTTGYNSMRFNAGEIQNRGVEAMVRGDIIRNGQPGFNWTATLNWSKNKNTVNALYGDLDAYQIAGGFGGVSSFGRPGQEWGLLEGLPYVRNDEGKIVVNSGGIPLTTSNPEVLGKVNPDWIGGINNEFSYKNFSLSFLIDAKMGGDIFSVTAWHSYPTGNFMNSVYNEEFVYPNVREEGVLVDGVYEDGTPNTSVVSPWSYFNGGWMWNNHEYSVLDASFVKLRELRLSYNFQVNQFAPWMQSLNVALIGRNLGILWRHDDTDLYGIDPETGFGGTEQGLGFENFQVPTTRTLGARLTVSF